MALSNDHYSKKLQPFARKLRNQSTKAEIRLWGSVLRDKQMLGYPFLRQRPVDKYIADFLCKPLKLIIELDGLTHTWEETVIKDNQKQKDLELMGYKVLRFNDEDVMKNIGNVSAVIEDWIRTNHSRKLGNDQSQ